MEDHVIFIISLDQDTRLWNIVSTDPEYEVLSEYQIIGGNQFMIMQGITDALAKEYDKVALFRIRDDGPEIQVIQVEAQLEGT